MRRLLPLALALLPGLAAAETSSWKIDPAHSEAGFAVKHLVVSTVRGHFGKMQGALTINENDLSKSKVEATIDASSIDTRVGDRDNHLKSPDFFDVEKYPTITFKSTKVQKAKADRLKVTGELTMKGTTKPVTFDVTYTKPITGMKGEVRRGFSGTTKINRKDFGLNWSKVVEAGPVVSDQVTIEVNVEAIKDQGTPAAAQAASATTQEEKKPAPASGSVAPQAGETKK